MAYFTDGAELQRCLTAFIEAFLASDAGAETARRVAAEAPGTEVHLRTRDPETALTVDLGARAVASGCAAPAPAGTVALSVDADTFHHFWLNQLDPVQIARAVDEGRLQVTGPPAALAALFPLAGVMQEHYAAALAQVAEHLLATPAPPTRTLWEKQGPLPRPLEDRLRAKARGRRAPAGA